jgi:alkylation response protein AidB-like acyl-CoA dehydrogenase
MSKEVDEAVLAAVEKWVRNEVAPIAQQHDNDDAYPHALVDQMKEMGLFGAVIAEEYGGLGLSAAVYAQIVWMVSAEWMAPSGIFNSHLIMATAIQRCGTQAQREAYLPQMATGELRGGLALTEPGAGTDLQAIRTSARRTESGDYVLTGTKTWITNSLHGNLLLVLAKTDKAAVPAHKGLSMFVVKTKNDDGTWVKGIAVNKLKKMGYRSIDTCEVVFEGVEVSSADLLGGVEGLGFQHAAKGLEIGRINVAARGGGIGAGALRRSLRYAQEREAFGTAICNHQSIQIKLAEMATRVEASRLLIEQAAKKYDAGERCDLEAGMAKLFATETGAFCAQEGMRIFGGYSYSVEYDIERLYRDCMLMCIGEGTNEMQRIIISKRLVEQFPI